MNSKASHDVTPEDLKLVKSILAKYIPNYDVYAFGSRARGTARKFSDLDLAVMSERPLNFDLYATLKDAFSESNLPFKIDIVDWASIDEKFQDVIKQHYLILQEKKM